MNPRTADKLIKTAQPVRLVNTWTSETGIGTPISRTRRNISILMEDGQVVILDRGEMEVVK